MRAWMGMSQDPLVLRTLSLIAVGLLICTPRFTVPWNVMLIVHLRMPQPNLAKMNVLKYSSSFGCHWLYC